MLFIVEILLTIFAWRNGWKWLALLPVGIAFFIAFFIGLGIGYAGGTVIPEGVIFIDLIAIGVLIYMTAKCKTPVEIPNKPENKTEI